MKRVVLLLICTLVATLVCGQGRSFIREQIEEHGECRNVAITKSNGDLMLYGSNGWASTSCPRDLTDALDELNDEGEYIDDVQLTEYGRWLILFGDNGFRWNDIPESLERQLREFNRDGEVVYSVTFNDNGEWIIISKNYYMASNSAISSWLKEGNDKYGHLWAACLTDDAAVAVYAEGYRFMGNVPQSLHDALQTTHLDVFRLKLAGTSWSFADKYGRFKYNM